MNFGAFVTPENNILFDVNDFDETLPAPWEWDLKRLAASAAVSVRFMGGDKEEAEAAARAVVRSYRKRMRRYAEMGFLQIWYDRIDERAVLDTLQSWSDVPLKPLSIDLYGQVFQVYMRHHDAPAFEARPIAARANPPAGWPHYIVLKLITRT